MQFPTPNAAQDQIYLNILFFTLLFIATGTPSSYSTPASPPSPECPLIFCLNSSSISATVFFFFLTPPLSSAALAEVDASHCPLPFPASPELEEFDRVCKGVEQRYDAACTRVEQHIQDKLHTLDAALARHIAVQNTQQPIVARPLPSRGPLRRCDPQGLCATGSVDFEQLNRIIAERISALPPPEEFNTVLKHYLVGEVPEGALFCPTCGQFIARAGDSHTCSPI